MIGHFFFLIFYQPLYNAFVFLIKISPSHDVGIAVILLTIIVRIILFPLSHKSILTQRKMREIEPDLKKIKEKFKNNKQEQSKKIMELYRLHGVSPFSGFLMLLIQLPILIALYKLFLSGVNFDHSNLYSFINIPDVIQSRFLGVIDVSKNSYILAVITGISQFFQAHFSIPKIKNQNKTDESFQDHLSRSMNTQARYIMPLFIFFMATRFSSGISLYWTAMNVFAIVHEVIVAYRAKKIEKRYGDEIRKY